MVIDQEPKAASIFVETLDHTWHQTPDDHEIADRNTETLDRNGRVEYNSGIWVCDLRESEEGRSAAVKVSRASRLKVKTEACGQACP